jgi:ABC-type nitrate/sulfonate/bicarbonate transport system permease component
MVALFATPIIVQCARTAIRDVDPHLVDIARSFCATRGQVWTKVILRAAAPGLLLAARLGLARAVEGMVVVELLLVAVGIGGLLLDFQGRFEAAHVYAVILVVIAEAAVLSHAGRRLERHVSPATAGRR